MKKVFKFSILFTVMALIFVSSGKIVSAEENNKDGDAVIEFRMQFDFGSRSDAVKFIQAILASDPSIFSSAYVTGYFGPLTREAVKKFQVKHGLPPAGRVGPLTLAKINELLREKPLKLEKKDGQDCAIIPPGHLIAPGFIKNYDEISAPACQIVPPGILRKLTGVFPPKPDMPDLTAPIISEVSAQFVGSRSVLISWKTNEEATGQVVFGTTGSYGSSTSVSSDRTKLHSIVLSGLLVDTTYHYQVRSVDKAGNASASADYTFTTLPSDSTAPVISNVTASGIGMNQATIKWETNELATTEIAYGTSASYGSAMTDLKLSAVHEKTLSGLQAGTTYHYKATSRDASGNISSSADLTFATSPSDATAPVISSISVSAIGKTSATVTWITNELASSKAYFSAVTPINLSTAESSSNTSLVLNHSVTLSNLSENTRYYIVVESEDQNANVARSGEVSFETK